MFSKNQALLTEAEIKQLISASSSSITTGQANQKIISQTARIGEQLSSTIGSGSDFAEVRAYHAGDDPRYIDWRATARSRLPLLRTYHSELNQVLYLLIDRSSSMRFATRVRLKVTQAVRMALWIAGQEARAGREIATLLLDNPISWLAPQQGMLAVKLIAKLANKACPPIKQQHRANWKSILSGLEQQISKGSEVILLSDFYGLSDADNKILAVLGNQYKTTAIHIFDPCEIDPNFVAAVQLQSGNKQSYFSVTNKNRLEQLKNKLQIRAEEIYNRFRKANISYRQVSVEEHELSSSWAKIL
ncbi:MAG: DUF58 domain-containing protein [Pseudomonadota bacterium]